MGKVKLVMLVIVAMLMNGNLAGAQNFNEEKTAMTSFIVRMYKSAPFEGVKVFTDYEHSYLLSVLTLDPARYPSQSALNRVAGVKAMSQASRYFNGSDISSDMIIRSVEHADGTADSEIIENIREKSAGYVKMLEFLTAFDNEENHRVFIFCKEIEK